MANSGATTDEVFEVERSSEARDTKRRRESSGVKDSIREFDGGDLSKLTDELREVKQQLRSVVEAVKSVTDEMGRLREVKQQLGSVVEAVKSVTDEMGRLSGSVVQILAKMSEHDEKLQVMSAKIGKQTDELVKTNEHVGGIERKMSSVDLKVRELEWKSIDQEARSRRNNLLFFGIQENEDENCSALIGDLIKHELKLGQREIPLQRAHRLGPRRANNTVGQGRSRPRPIIVAFLDHRDREAVRSARFDLRPPHSIAEDFPVQIRRARETLLPELREIKNTGKRATIAYPARLIVEGKVVREASVLGHPSRSSQR